MRPTPRPAPNAGKDQGQDRRRSRTRRAHREHDGRRTGGTTAMASTGVIFSAAGAATPPGGDSRRRVPGSPTAGTAPGTSTATPQTCSAAPNASAEAASPRRLRHAPLTTNGWPPLKPGAPAAAGPWNGGCSTGCNPAPRSGRPPGCTTPATWNWSSSHIWASTGSPTWTPHCCARCSPRSLRCRTARASRYRFTAVRAIRLWELTIEGQRWTSAGARAGSVGAVHVRRRTSEHHRIE
jgi:hypothetical protein